MRSSKGLITTHALTKLLTEGFALDSVAEDLHLEVNKFE